MFAKSFECLLYCLLSVKGDHVCKLVVWQHGLNRSQIVFGRFDPICSDSIHTMETPVLKISLAMNDCCWMNFWYIDFVWTIRSIGYCLRRSRN